MDSHQKAAHIHRVTLERTGCLEQADLAAAFVLELSRPSFNVNVPTDFAPPPATAQRLRKARAA